MSVDMYRHRSDDDFREPRSLRSPAGFALRCFLSLLLFALIGCDGSDSTTIPADEKPAQELFDFSTRHVKGNAVQWELKAVSATFLESSHSSLSEPDRVLVNQPEVLIYENGTPATQIFADSGEILQEDLTFDGNVKAIHGDGTLYTEQLHWYNGRSEIYAPTRVKMVRGDSVIYADQLRADPRLKRVQLSNPEGRVYPKDEDAYAPIQ